nr:carboxypeptidase-like regulatory domain-containing protein [Candidatus Cloacimonadota bacterium]
MRKIFILLVLSFIAQIQALDVIGRVLDQTKSPLQNVVISTSQKAVVSNEKGIFMLRGLAENEQVTVHKIGFQDQFYPALKLPSQIIMISKPISVEGVTVHDKANELKLTASTNTTVIEMDKNENWRSTADVLENRADLIVKGSGLEGEARYVSVPGFQTRHTLIMLDGVALN